MMSRSTSFPKSVLNGIPENETAIFADDTPPQLPRSPAARRLNAQRSEAQRRRAQRSSTLTELESFQLPTSYRELKPQFTSNRAETTTALSNAYSFTEANIFRHWGEQPNSASQHSLKNRPADPRRLRLLISRMMQEIASTLGTRESPRTDFSVVSSILGEYRDLRLSEEQILADTDIPSSLQNGHEPRKLVDLDINEVDQVWDYALRCSMLDTADDLRRFNRPDASDLSGEPRKMRLQFLRRGRGALGPEWGFLNPQGLAASDPIEVSNLSSSPDPSYMGESAITSPPPISQESNEGVLKVTKAKAKSKGGRVRRRRKLDYSGRLRTRNRVEAEPEVESTTPEPSINPDYEISDIYSLPSSPESAKSATSAEIVNATTYHVPVVSRAKFVQIRPGRSNKPRRKPRRPRRAAKPSQAGEEAESKGFQSDGHVDGVVLERGVVSEASIAGTEDGEDSSEDEEGSRVAGDFNHATDDMRSRGSRRRPRLSSQDRRKARDDNTADLFSSRQRDWVEISAGALAVSTLMAGAGLATYGVLTGLRNKELI